MENEEKGIHDFKHYYYIESAATMVRNTVTVGGKKWPELWIKGMITSQPSCPGDGVYLELERKEKWVGVSFHSSLWLTYCTFRIKAKMARFCQRRTRARLNKKALMKILMYASRFTFWILMQRIRWWDGARNLIKGMASFWMQLKLYNFLSGSE